MRARFRSFRVHSDSEGPIQLQATPTGSPIWVLHGSIRVRSIFALSRIAGDRLEQGSAPGRSYRCRSSARQLLRYEPLLPPLAQTPAQSHDALVLGPHLHRAVRHHRKRDPVARFEPKAISYVLWDRRLALAGHGRFGTHDSSVGFLTTDNLVRKRSLFKVRGPPLPKQ